MDEGSSRFVDRLVMGKLLAEKLEKVHHQPAESDRTPAPLFDDFVDFPPVGEMLPQSDTRWLFMRSPVPCVHPENRVVPVTLHHAPKSCGTILFAHGLFEDNRDIHQFLIGGLNRRGYSVKLLTLPFHYERVPAESRFSGEYFWSANTRRSLQAVKQAVYELYQLYNWSIQQDASPVFVLGFSMGARIALLLSTLFPGIAGLFVVNPAAALPDIVWDSPLCRTVKEDYLAAGYDRRQLRRAYACLEPELGRSPSMDPNRVCLAYALYDEITDQAHYHRLAHDWGLKHVLEYKSGHLNTLRVPRLAEDIAQFFRRLNRGEKA
jgi:pimeloyl-ACP methyl ester carboxylesterase